jgi:hypothetical protein
MALHAMPAARSNHWLSRPAIGMLVLALAAASLLWSVAASRWSEETGLERWHRQLAAVPDRQVVDYLRDATAKQDEPTQLVQLLGSPRPGVVRAAQQLLMERLDRWQLEPVRRTSPRIARLAKMLADHSHDWEPAALEAASELAAGILLWPVDGRVIDEERLIVECEQVLRACVECRSEKVNLTGGGQRGHQTSPPSEIAGSVRPIDHGEQHDQPAPLEQQFALPGGNLPLRTSRIGSEPPTRAASSTRK